MNSFLNNKYQVHTNPPIPIRKVQAPKTLPKPKNYDIDKIRARSESRGRRSRRTTTEKRIDDECSVRAYLDMTNQAESPAASPERGPRGRSMDKRQPRQNRGRSGPGRQSHLPVLNANNDSSISNAPSYIKGSPKMRPVPGKKYEISDSDSNSPFAIRKNMNMNNFLNKGKDQFNKTMAMANELKHDLKDGSKNLAKTVDRKIQVNNHDPPSLRMGMVMVAGMGTAALGTGNQQQNKTGSGWKPVRAPSSDNRPRTISTPATQPAKLPNPIANNNSRIPVPSPMKPVHVAPVASVESTSSNIAPNNNQLIGLNARPSIMNKIAEMQAQRAALEKQKIDEYNQTWEKENNFPSAPAANIFTSPQQPAKLPPVAPKKMSNNLISTPNNYGSNNSLPAPIHARSNSNLTHDSGIHHSPKMPIKSNSTNLFSNLGKKVSQSTESVTKIGKTPTGGAISTMMGMAANTALPTAPRPALAAPVLAKPISISAKSTNNSPQNNRRIISNVNANTPKTITTNAIKNTTNNSEIPLNIIKPKAVDHKTMSNFQFKGTGDYKRRGHQKIKMASSSPEREALERQKHASSKPDYHQSVVSFEDQEFMVSCEFFYFGCLLIIQILTVHNLKPFSHQPTPNHSTHNSFRPRRRRPHPQQRLFPNKVLRPRKTRHSRLQ